MNMASGHIKTKTLKNGKKSYNIVIDKGRDPMTGKRLRVQKAVKNITKKEAEKILRNMLIEAEQGLLIDSNNITVEQHILRWEEDVVKPLRARSTARAYETYIHQYIIPGIGKIKLQSLSTYTVQQFYNEFMKSPTIRGTSRSPRSLRKLHMVLRASLEMAVDYELIKKNPAAKAKLPKCNKYKGEVYTIEEINELINLSVGTNVEMPVLLALALGARRGELLALTWDDLNFATSEVTICKSLGQIKGEVFVKTPKTESSVRTISIPNNVLQQLKKHRHEQLKFKLKFGREYVDRKLILCKDNGDYLKLDALSNRFAKFMKKTGMRHLRFHDLRHLHATMLLSLGIPAKIAQERLGHQSISTTLDIYSHVLKEDEQKAVRQIDDAIFSNTINM